MRGSVDKVTADGSVGWLFAEANGHKPLVQAFLHHQVIGQAVADRYRPDLEQAGLGDGRHGFEIGFNGPIEPSHLPFVTLRPEGFDLAIPAHGTGSFLDLVQHVMADYPVSGRTRSVLGGLWTDRLDAPALLAGRVAVGSVAAEVQAGLSGLISDGQVTLHGVMAAHGLGERELELVHVLTAAPRDAERVEPEVRSALSALAGLLFNEPLVRLLRAMFDDHPVAYRLDVLRRASSGFAQACTMEALPSPAECALVYLCAGPGARIEVVRDGHELSEFSRDGKSRWTAQGASAVRDLVGGRGGSIDVTEMDKPDMLVMGPGTIHRVMASEASPVLRVLLAPRRVTPVRFLVGEAGWLEGAHVSGARLRL